MQIKKSLIKEIDSLIAKHGAKDPQLLHDLQKYRDALANELTKKEIAQKAYAIARIVKFFYDNWPPEF